MDSRIFPMTESDQLELLLVGGLFLVVLGLRFLWMAARNTLRARRSRVWPRTPGKVTGHELNRTKVHGGTFFIPVVRYEYFAGEQARMGDRINFGDPAPMVESLAQEMLGRYPVGSVADVIYDPSAPEFCALHSRPELMMPLTYGLTLMAVGLVLLVARAAA